MRLYVAFALLLGIFLSSSLVDSRRSGGGGGFGRSSSSGGFFSRSRSSSSSSRGWGASSSGSSYPKQQWGTNTGGSSGGSSYPKQQWGGSAAGGSNVGGSYPKQQYGSNYYGSGSYGTGGIGGGGFARPGTYGSYGSAAAGSSASKYSYSAPGYGTNFGTNFAGGVGRYGSAGSGLTKKKLGLGVGAGFLGGAALGVAGSVAAMSVYHRYWQYKQLLYMHQYGSWNNNGYNNYVGGVCFGGCPLNSFCQFGFCECGPGFERRFGRCWRPTDDWRQARIADPFVVCRDNSDCQRMDMNLICNTNKTVQQGGRCECREDMRWNERESECQLYLDVDCSSITYDTKPSPIVLEAVNATLEKINSTTTEAPTTTTTTLSTTESTTSVSTEASPESSSVSSEGSSNSESTTTTTTTTTTTATVDPKALEENQKKINETLSNSLLSSIDPKKASEKDIKEAYCRDIDTFSWEFANAQPLRSSAAFIRHQMAALVVPTAILCAINLLL